MRLGRNEELVMRKLNEFDKVRLIQSRVHSGEDETLCLHALQVLGRNFVSVPVSLEDCFGSVFQNT